VTALKDTDSDVRATAAWALGEIQSPRAREGLTAAQRDESGAVRHAAIWALRQLSDNEAGDDGIHVHVHPHVHVHVSKVKP